MKELKLCESFCNFLEVFAPPPTKKKNAFLLSLMDQYQCCKCCLLVCTASLPRDLHVMWLACRYFHVPSCSPVEMLLFIFSYAALISQSSGCWFLGSVTCPCSPNVPSRMPTCCSQSKQYTGIWRLMCANTVLYRQHRMNKHTQPILC